MSCLMSVQLLILGLLQVCFLPCIAKEYYITPTQSSDFKCPAGKPCYTLDYYATNINRLFKGENQVYLLFLSGDHYLTVPLYMTNIANVTLIGLNSSSSLDSPRMITRDSAIINFMNITTLKMEFLNIKNENYPQTPFIYCMNDVLTLIQNHILTSGCGYKIQSDSHLNYELHNTENHRFQFYHDSLNGVVLIEDSTFTNVSRFTINGNGAISSFVLKNVTYRGNNLLPLSNFLYFGKFNEFKSLSNLTIDNCHLEENAGIPSFLMIVNSNVYYKGNTTFAKNFGDQGGAMNLVSSYLHLEENSEIIFFDNSVTNVGGAIYTNYDLCDHFSGTGLDENNCFYQVPQDYNGYITVLFINNTSIFGGNHVYGASFKSHCQVSESELGFQYGNTVSFEIQEKVFQYTDKTRHNVSQVASKAERVCLCDEKGNPQCAKYSYIVQHRALTSGEKLNVSVAVVGGDFGIVPGVVYANLIAPSNDLYFLKTGNRVNIIQSPVCTSLEYSVYSSGNKLSFFIGIDSSPQFIHEHLNYSIDAYEDSYHIDDRLRTTPVLIHIDIQTCPMGLILNNYSYTCECTDILTENGIDHCVISSSKGLVYRNETTWIGLYKTNDSSNTTDICTSHDCPYGYCKTDNIPIDPNDSDFQCELGHVGILCGSCQTNLSLALGSSKCLSCSNNRGLALIIGFLAAGPTLVFLIKILDLTVSRGTINGLILYANIIWINKDILLVSDRFNSDFSAFKVFVAWLNLDFGIETCFFHGLSVYWKTWLQFVFPIYLWIIVLIIIVLCRYSTKFTNVFGNNIVSVLATLFLMSYIKLLRTIVTALEFAVLYSQDGPWYVWLYDGNYAYFGWKHSILFVTALLVLTGLILPYTLTLLCVPYLKQKSDWFLLSWINRFKPIFDAYYGPLQDNYHFWIGVTLLFRVFLALLNTARQIVTSNIILVLTGFLSAVMLMIHAYKSIYLSALERYFLMNLILLCSLHIIISTEIGTILVLVSIGVSFLTFLGILIFHVYIKIKKCQKGKSQHDNRCNNQRLNRPIREMVPTATLRASNESLMESDRLRESLLESIPTY